MMSKKLYVGIYAGALALVALPLVIGIALLLIGRFIESKDSLDIGLLTFQIGFSLPLFIFLIVHIVFNFLLLAKMWGAIQDGQTEISVGKAIGFLFIPIYSVYWIFRAWGSFPTEYNKYIDRYGLAVPKLSSGVFVAVPVLILLSGLIFPFLILPFVFIFLISKVCDAVNNLNQASQSRRNFAPPVFHQPNFH